MISRLHYITQETEGKSHIENIEEACKAGIDWIELKINDLPEDEILATAYEAKAVCKEYGAKLIINEHVNIAQQVKANGVLLNDSDFSPSEVREILGDQYIVGASANTWDDVVRLCQEPIDYIELKPFKQTSSKKGVYPELGIKGYSNILNNMIIHDMDMPIIACGGIEVEDIVDIQMAGCYGIAVASLINHSIDKKDTIESIISCLPSEEF
ncbi:MAG: thiamine phosphate synthase [Reichenbachiella sp.]